MEDRSPRGYTRQPASCQILFHGRSAGIIMAIPFVLCFTLFGVFNLVGGTVLTIMACKPKLSKKGLELWQKIMRKTDIKFQQQLDPMQVVGIILLLTGSMLVIIGISLGIVACRSVNEDKRRRKGIEEASMSGMILSTMTERSSRRTSSATFSPYAACHKGRKKSFPSENIASPILEVDSEEEERWDCPNSNDNFEKSSPELRNITFRQTSCIKSKEKENCFKVTWATDVQPLPASSTIQVVAEVIEPSQIHSNDSPKILLTTDL